MPKAHVKLDLNAFAKRAVKQGPWIAFGEAFYNLMVATNDLLGGHIQDHIKPKTLPTPKKDEAPKG